MSVPEPKRKESTMEFLKCAEEIDAKTLSFCVKYVPKRYTFLLSTYLSSLANDIHVNAVAGNFTPKSADDARKRRAHFIAARQAANAYASKLKTVIESVHPPMSAVEEISVLCFKEIKSLNGILESDEKRFKF